MSRTPNPTPPQGNDHAGGATGAAPDQIEAGAAPSSPPQETPEERAAREASEREAAERAKGNKKAIVVIARHKTPHAVYRRAGLVLGKVTAEMTVTADQLAILQADPWVEVEKK